MYTLYKINADELNENFIASIKAQFQHKDIEIAICETVQTEQDETDYLLSHPANEAMYDVVKMKTKLEDAVQQAKKEISNEFTTAFKNIYLDNKIPSKFNNDANVITYEVKGVTDLDKIYSGKGFYIILSNYPVENNQCRLSHELLKAIYRGECSTVKKRIKSHLSHTKYKEEYEKRKANYLDNNKNTGKSFYEDFWPHCIKLKEGGAGGIDIEEESYKTFKWMVIVHRMEGSSQGVRELAERGFDEAFEHPGASRDAS